MGLTIEEEDRYPNACIKCFQKNMECVGYRDYIIERLNKYQKIEQIVKEWGNSGLLQNQLYDLIKEVIENWNE